MHPWNPIQSKRAWHRLALVAVAVSPGVIQGVNLHRFTVTYEFPLRTVALTPPTGAVLECQWSEGSILLGKAEVLDALDDRIRDRRNQGRSTEYWDTFRAEVERDARKRNGDCSVPANVAAALLERGHATVTTKTGESITALTEWSVAWVYDGRPSFYSSGDGRAFTRVHVHYRPDPEAANCGSGCVLYAGDHAVHHDSVI